MGYYEDEIAYDVDGNEVMCDCGGIFFYDSSRGDYFCPECGQRRTKIIFCEMAGLEIDEHCIQCGNNYPACKEGCSYWEQKEYGW